MAENMDAFAQTFTSDRLIQIYVGERTEDSVPYLVSNRLLRAKFPYFRKLLSSNFKEGQSGVLHFPEDGKGAWKVLLFYMFSGDILKFNKVKPTDSTSDEAFDRYCVMLAEAWSLSDKYDLPGLHDKIVRFFMHTAKNARDGYSLWPMTLHYLETLPVGSPIRKLLLEEVVLSVKQGRLHWDDLKDLVQIDAAFALLMHCLEEYNENPKGFPKHMYGASKTETAKLLREEKRQVTIDFE